LINIKGNDSIAAVTKVMKEDEAEEAEGEILEDGLDGEEGTAEDSTEVQE
jgi:DNA gyrase subunit A